MNEINTTTTVPMEDRYLSLEEAAVYCHTPLSTFRKWVQAKRVKHYKPGKRLLFLKADLDRFMKSTAA